MRIKNPLPWYVTPIVLGGLAALGVAGCNIQVPNSAAVCSGGKCATVSAIPNSASARPKHTYIPPSPTQTPTTAAPDNTVTVTATPAPSVTPTVIVAGCSVYLTHDELYQLANSAQAPQCPRDLHGDSRGELDPRRVQEAVAFENQLAILQTLI